MAAGRALTAREVTGVPDVSAVVRAVEPASVEIQMILYGLVVTAEAANRSAMAA